MPACARKCQICSCWPRRAAAAHRAPRKKTQRAGDERIRDAKDLLRSLAGHDMADDRQGGCTEDRGDERPKHFGGLRHNLYLSTAKLPVFFPEVRVDLMLFCNFWFQFGRWSEINNLAGDTIFEVARVVSNLPPIGGPVAQVSVSVSRGGRRCRAGASRGA